MMQGEMMKSNEIDNIILSHDLHVAGQRPHRDTSNHLDENLQPIPFQGPEQGGVELPLRGGLSGGVLPPADVPEGFDLSTVEPQEDGQFCVFKKLSIEGWRD